jgi:phospholipid/cholesterol/gamma-HCH transport system substrate-binding protein
LELGGDGIYPLQSRFSKLAHLRLSAPLKGGGVTIGRLPKIDLDPVKLDSVLTLDIDDRYKDLPGDTSAGILTAGLLGESFVGLSPGGDPEALKPGDEIAYTTPSVDLIQMVGKYMFSGGGASSAPAGKASPEPAPSDTPDSSTEPSQ